MTVAELIEELRFIDPNAEVRLAQQPRWAFEYSIDAVVEVELDDDEDDEKTVVYISEGEQLGYLPVEAKNRLYW